MRTHLLTALALAAITSGPFGITTIAQAQNAVTPRNDPSAPLTYADLVDLVLRAPVVADVAVRRATRLRGDQAAGVAPGHTRYLIQADVRALIRAPGGLPGQVSYVVDLPDDARGRAARVEREARYLILAVPNPGRTDLLRLAAPYAQFPWSAAEDARVRSVISALIARDAPPQITRVGGAFHVPGAIPGESETQIFLRTADERPISLTVLRRPGEQPRWAVALGEMTDDSAEPPARDTLLWYRLACGLPPALPDAATADLAPAEAAAARADYGVVLRGLGPCTRNHAS